MRAVLAGLLVLIAAAWSPTSHGADPSDLLRTYEPVLYFHPEEDWAPTRPEPFLGMARLERQVARGTWAEAPLPLPTSNAGCALSPCFRLNLPCALRSGDACYERLSDRLTDWSEPVIFGSVVSVPAGSASPPGFTTAPRYLVRYWLFYMFDDWHSAHRRLWQAHEGDWESITVGLDAGGLPQFAAYSQHCTGSLRAWGAVEKRGGTHPVAYVALGSHANDFTNTSTSTRFTECLKKGLVASAATKAVRLVRLAQDRVTDRTGTAHPVGPPDVPGTTPAQLVQLDTSTPWARFPGRWSEGQILWLGSVPRSVTTVSQGLGPATPRWTSTSIPSLWHADSS